MLSEKNIKNSRRLLSSLTLLMLSALPCLTKANFLSAGEARHQCSACPQSTSIENTACCASSKTTIRTKIFEHEFHELHEYNMFRKDFRFFRAFTLCSFSRHGITQASLVLLIWLGKCSVFVINHGPKGDASEGGLFSPKAMFLLDAVLWRPGPPAGCLWP